MNIYILDVLMTNNLKIYYIDYIFEVKFFYYFINKNGNCTKTKRTVVMSTVLFQNFIPKISGEEMILMNYLFVNHIIQIFYLKSRFFLKRSK